MTDQKDRLLLHVDDAVRRDDVISKRTQRVLDRDRLEPALRQKRNDLCPARAVSERSMDEHDRFDSQVGYSLCCPPAIYAGIGKRPVQALRPCIMMPDNCERTMPPL